MSVTKTIPPQAGLGLRPLHYKEVLKKKPDVSWFEVHSENYFGDGGLPHFYLEQIGDLYPLSFHGVGLSIGSADKLDRLHLKKLKTVVDKYKPALVSEHLSWSAIDKRNFNDLLPIPYTDESFTNFCAKVNQIQDYLGRQILIENPSSYIRFADSHLNEWEFFAGLPQITGCGLLLDVNNVFVSCANHGYDFSDYLKVINPDDVKEYHLAGFARKSFAQGEVLIDNHGCKVHKPVWDLFGSTLDMLGVKPSLIEWDTNIPQFAVLAAEGQKAQNIIDGKNVTQNSTAICS